MANLHNLQAGQTLMTATELQQRDNATLDELAATKIHGWQISFGSWQSPNGEFLRCHLYGDKEGAVIPVTDYTPTEDRNQSGELLLAIMERGGKFKMALDEDGGLTLSIHPRSETIAALAAWFAMEAGK